MRETRHDPALPLLHLHLHLLVASPASPPSFATLRIWAQCQQLNDNSNRARGNYRHWWSWRRSCGILSWLQVEALAWRGFSFQYVVINSRVTLGGQPITHTHTHTFTHVNGCVWCANEWQQVSNTQMKKSVVFVVIVIVVVAPLPCVGSYLRQGSKTSPWKLLWVWVNECGCLWVCSCVSHKNKLKLSRHIRWLTLRLSHSVLPAHWKIPLRKAVIKVSRVPFSLSNSAPVCGRCLLFLNLPDDLTHEVKFALLFNLRCCRACKFEFEFE